MRIISRILLFPITFFLSILTFFLAFLLDAGIRLLNIVSGVILIGAITLLFMFILVRIIPKSKILNYYGQNTMVILGTHYFIKYGYIIIDKLFFDSQVTTKDSFVISLGLTLIMLIIYLPLTNVYSKLVTKEYTTVLK